MEGEQGLTNWKVWMPPLLVSGWYLRDNRNQQLYTPQLLPATLIREETAVCWRLCSPDGRYIEENSHHKETQELQPQTADITVVDDCCCQIVANQGNTCEHPHK